MPFRRSFIATAGPNTALIKSSGNRHVRVIIGGRMLAIPVIQRVDTLSLKLRTITVHTVRGTTINGVGVDVTSCCQVKIQGWSSTPEDDKTPRHERIPAGGDLHIDRSAIRLAAQHFIGKNDKEIENALQKTIAGHQRAIIGALTVEELYRDRATFSKRVLSLCHDDMRTMGLTIVSYTVAEITDELGYLDALGVTQTELVKREAAEGAAIHRGAASAKAAIENAEAHLVSNQQQQRKIESDKLRKITDAKAQTEVDIQLAIQHKAHQITEAEQDAVLLVERQKAYAAEAKARLRVLEQGVEKQKLEMQRLVHVEADAMLYKAQVEANGVRATAGAEAERIRAVGEAEASAIRAKGKAEIDVLRDRVLVWKECGNQAAMIEQMIDVLPKVAAAVSAPLAKTEKMVFVASGGAGGGPSQFTREVERVVAEMPETVNALTGFDMRKGLANLMGNGSENPFVHGIGEGLSAAATTNALTKRGHH